MATQFLFQPRKARITRFGKFAGLPVDLVRRKAGGMMMVTCAGQSWNPFTAYEDELTALDKPIHGSPGNYIFNNDGSHRTCDNDDSQ